MALGRFGRQPSGVAGLTFVLGAVFVALAAPLLAPYSPAQQFPGSELVSPSAHFLLGTDNLGRDVLSRLMFGARTSLLVGIVAVAVGAGLGCAGGLVAGYAGGPLGAVVMRVSDAVFAVPAVMLGLACALAFGPGALTVAGALGVATMPTFTRLTRAAVLAERSKEYVLAAATLGATSPRLITQHILANVLAPLLVQAALTMAAAVLLESGLSFLGLGAQPPVPTWGGMLLESRQFLRQAPWYAAFPGLAVTLLVLSLNAVADGLRDALDPRVQSRGSSG
jgi:ABC-type dipeptide/oligopeptide/nickel transport system permease subunit